MLLRPALLPSLAVFAAAARHQNFAHAAGELHLTASAVSHHVRKLESLLGVTLFQRHARGVTLTHDGRQLADAATAAMADLSSVAGNLRPDAGARILRISSVHSLVHCWLLPRLPQFCAAHPEVRLEIDATAVFARFEEGGPDLAVRYGPGHWPGLSAHHLMDDAMFPVASPRLPGVDAIREPRQIPSLPLISDLTQQGWRDWFQAAGVRGVELPAMHSFSDSSDAMRAAAEGIGAALARRHLALDWLQRGELVRLPGPTMKARFSYYVVYPAHRQPAPAAVKFIDWIKQQAQAAPWADAPPRPTAHARRRKA